MAWDDIPRSHSFSLGDFHDFDSCVFKFFVNHNLNKKYELAEGSNNQTIGSLLDLAVKKLHLSKAYNQPPDYLVNLIKAAENEIREKVAKAGHFSFYGAQIPYLTEENISKAKEVFKNYLQNVKKVYQGLSTTTFWDYIIPGSTPIKIWGGPDAVEMGEDSIPEVIDYKYYENGTDRVDMDLMPKVYILLCSKELQKAGYSRARFKVKLWNEPENESFYEEFDLDTVPNLANFFQDKIERILRTKELSFCEKDYCKVCKSEKRQEWIKELQNQGWIE